MVARLLTLQSPSNSKEISFHLNRFFVFLWLVFSQAKNNHQETETQRWDFRANLCGNFRTESDRNVKFGHTLLGMSLAEHVVVAACGWSGSAATGGAYV